MKNYCMSVIKSERREKIFAIIGTIGLIIFSNILFVYTETERNMKLILIMVGLNIFYLFAFVLLVRGLKEVSQIENTGFVQAIREYLLKQGREISLEEILTEINGDIHTSFGNIYVGDKWLIGKTSSRGGTIALQIENIQYFSYTTIRKEKGTDFIVSLYCKEPILYNRMIQFSSQNNNCHKFYEWLKVNFSEKEREEKDILKNIYNEYENV